MAPCVAPPLGGGWPKPRYSDPVGNGWPKPRYSEILRPRAEWCRGEAQQTQLAMSLVLHRTPGIGALRDFIRFSRCLFRRILNRYGFERMFALGRGGAMAEVHSFANIVRFAEKPGAH